MSRIGFAYAVLEEQAQELGFETLDQALNSGYVALYNVDNGKLELTSTNDIYEREAHRLELAEEQGN